MRYKKLLMFLVILTAVMGVGGLYFVKARSPRSPGLPAEPSIVHGGEFVTNLLPNGPYRYIRVQVDIEVDTKEGADTLNKRSSEVKDSILRVLRSKGWQDVAGRQGMEQLTREMAEQLTGLLDGKGTVTRVFFTEFVVQ